MFLSLKKTKSIVMRAVLGTVFIVAVVFFSIETQASSYKLVLKPRLEYKAKQGNTPWTLRKQAKLQFLDVPLQPYIADEVFFEMGNGFGFRKNRVSIGLTPYKNLTTFYILETCFGDFGERTEHKNTIGIQLKLDF